MTHRFWEAAKYKTTMTWSPLTQAQFAALAVLFYNFGEGVTYSNSNSGLTFFGFPTVAEDSYIPGASYMKTLTVTLVQQ